MNVTAAGKEAFDGKEIAHPGMMGGHKVRWFSSAYRGRFQEYWPTSDSWQHIECLDVRNDWYIVEPKKAQVENAEFDWQQHAIRLREGLLKVLHCLDGENHPNDDDAIEAAADRAVVCIKELESERNKVQRNYNAMSAHLYAFLETKGRSCNRGAIAWHNVTQYAEKLEAELEELRKPTEVESADEKLEVWRITEHPDLGDLWVGPAESPVRVPLHRITGEEDFRGWHFKGCHKVMPSSVAFQAYSGAISVECNSSHDVLIMRDGVYMRKE